MLAWFNIWQLVLKHLKAYGIIPDTALLVPSIPSNLRADQEEAGFIRIAWDEGSGLVTAFSYQVYRNSAPIAIVTNQLYLDPNLPPNQSFTYQVQAISSTGAASGLSEQLVVSTTVNTAPVWQEGNTLFGLTEGQAFSLDLNSICDDADGQTITYSVSSGSLPSGVQLQGTTISGTPDFASQGDHNVTLQADDGHGGVTALSTTFRVANVDITAPSVPQSLVATNVTSVSCSLSWQASTDTETGVSFYNIYQKIGAGASVIRATSTTNSFDDAGLSASTAYSYKISAVDGNGNESGLSASAAVNTTAAPDTTPPTAPSGLLVTAFTTSTVGLSWSGSTDVGTGVGGYNVYLSTVSGVAGFSKLSSTPGNSLTISSLGSGTTYWFKVSAFDNATPANESAFSNVVSQTTASTTTPAIKFHSGHYLLSADRMNTTSNGYQTSYITSRPAEVIGWEQLINWSAIETSRGVYDFTKVDALLALCAQNKVRLVVQCLDRSFNASGDTSMLPAYLQTEPGANGGWYAKPNGGVVPKYWLQAVADRFIALTSAFAAKYDSHPYFEGLVLIETDLNFTVGPSDYSVQGYMNQLYRICDAQAAQWPHTSVMQQANFLPSNEVGMEDYVINHMIPARIEMSNPDIKGSATNTGFAPLSWGQRIAAGYRYRNGAWTSGFQTYTSVQAQNAELQDPDMGGKASHGTCAQNYDLAINGMKLTRMMWERKNFALPAQYTAAQLMYDNTNYTGTSAGGVITPDIKTYLSTPVGTHPLVVAKPSFYTSITTS